MRPDESGHHTHVMNIGDKPQNIQTLCSAIMLIDMSRCGHVRLDELTPNTFSTSIMDYGSGRKDSGWFARHTCALHISAAPQWSRAANGQLNVRAPTAPLHPLVGGYGPDTASAGWNLARCPRNCRDRAAALNKSTGYSNLTAKMDDALRMVRKAFAGLDAYPALKNYAVICARGQWARRAGF